MLPAPILRLSIMYAGQLVFSQVMDHLPMHIFRKCVRRYGGNRYVKSFPCLSQFLCMAFAQLAYRESLRDIEVGLRAQRNKLYHMGIRGKVSRNTLANANKQRDWRIHAEFAQELMRIARPLHAGEALGLELDNAVFALDASTIDLCLSVFPWALFRSTKSAVKLHTLLDLRGNIPTFIHISHGKIGDVKVLDMLVPEPGAFYVMDRAYIDFRRLNVLHSAGAFFVVRAKSNTKYRRRYSRPVETSTGSNDHPDGYGLERRLPAAAASGEVPGRENREDIRLFDQQLRHPAGDRCRPLSPQVASGIVFQMDQATPADQVLFRHLGERCEDPNLDRRRRVRARRHRQEATRHPSRSLHFFAGFEPHLVRENTIICNTFGRRLHGHAKA